jgi:hypothetical protein
LKTRFSDRKYIYATLLLHSSFLLCIFFFFFFFFFFFPNMDSVNRNVRCSCRRIKCTDDYMTFRVRESFAELIRVISVLSCARYSPCPIFSPARWLFYTLPRYERSQTSRRHPGASESGLFGRMRPLTDARSVF